MRKRRFFSSLQIGVVVAGFVILLWWSDLFPQTQLRLTNLLYSPRDTTGNVVIVAMDDASLAAYGRSPAEWSRDHHAKLVNIVAQGGARVIVFDILFLEPTPQDEQFASAIQEARQSYAATRTLMPVVGLAPLQNSTGPPAFEDVRFPTDTLKSAVEMLGTSFHIPDVDGTTRRLPMQITDTHDTYYSLDLAAYLAYLRIPPAAIPQVIQFQKDAIQLPSGRFLPLDERGQMMVYFFSQPDNTPFPVYSYRDVLEGDVDPSVFRDKLVLVGLMNSEGQTDLHDVPLGVEGARIAGVEIHANAIETLLQAIPLRPQSPTSQLLMIIVLAFLASLIYDNLPQFYFNGWLLLTMILGVLVWVVVAALIFSTQAVVVNLFYGLLAIILPAPTLLGGRLVGEMRQRQRVELLLDSIIRASGQQLSLDHIIPEIGADLHRILGCKHVEIWLWDKKQKSVFCAYTSPEKLPLDRSESLVNQALDTRKSGYQEKVMVFPMFWQYQPLGVLVGYPIARLRESTREMLELFVRQMGVLLANIYLLEEARQLSELKTFIIRMASHDLKNPLTAIVNFSFFLVEDNKKKGFLSQEHLEFVEDIQRAAGQMRAIINNILDLEKVRGGVKKSEIRDMTSLLQELAADFKKNVEQKHQRLTVEVPDHPIRMVMDSDQLRLAFINLLNNAVKYTPEGGNITVTCTMNQNKVRVDFTDTGYGIPEEAQQNLFKEFFRVRTEATRNIEGTGLGLSLVKSVIEAHGGRIWVKSQLGAGSTFSVELPIIYQESPRQGR